MNNPRLETFHLTNETIHVSVMTPRFMIGSDQLARYFAEDLEQLVHVAGINLAEELQISSEYPSDNRDIISMLYEDLAHMLRDSLITSIHLLLSDPQVDPNRDSYPIRYHLQYTIDSNDRYVPSTPITSFRSHIAPTPDIWQGARFALIIDWGPLAKERRHRVGRPQYSFDWVPNEARFDITNLIHYRDDYLAVDGASLILRSEAASPRHVPDKPFQHRPSIGQGELPEQKSLSAEEIPLSLYAVARAVLEDDNKALVGKTYSAQAGVSLTKPEGFMGELFDIPSYNITIPLAFDLLIHTSEHIRLTTDWHKKLLFNPYEIRHQLLEFTFRVAAQGHASLSVDFYHERRWLRTIQIEFDSIEMLQDPTVLWEV